MNKYPEFVAYLVRSLKRLCPVLGKVRIAQILMDRGLLSPQQNEAIVDEQLMQLADESGGRAFFPTSKRSGRSLVANR